ncbi:MAG: dprA, partial [Solirubrobacteraceae bacterium]|nr:dprA [Solirubrobacteraceae bacterium]
MPSPPEAAHACDACLRRTRLLELLAPHVEKARHERRLAQLLSLDEDDLLHAIAGQRRPGFAAALRRFVPAEARSAADAAGLRVLCRHADGYPSRLRD